jgi:hypothetical protein
MRCYNRRLAILACRRKARGEFGRKNSGNQYLFGGFNLRIPTLLGAFVKGICLWILLEMRELFVGGAPVDTDSLHPEKTAENSVA